MGDQRRYLGGTNARRWAASQSRDPVVMIVMSVRAASVCWGWYAGNPRCNIPTQPPNETERARNRDANQIGVEAETGWGSGAIGSPTAEKRALYTLMENVPKEVILI